MVSGDGVMRDAQESALPRMVGAVAAIWQVAMLIQVLIYLHDYRHPAVQAGVWLGILATVGWLLPRARAGGLSRAQAAVAVAVAVAAVVLVGWDRRVHGDTGTVDWSVVGTAWLLAFVALSRPAWEWASGALLIFAAHAAFAVHMLGVTSLSLARLALTAYTLLAILVLFAALRPTLRTHARMAARRAALASRRAAERAAATAVHEDRRERLALLEVEALPLRRALTDRVRTAGGLVAELEPALHGARARGLPVEVQVVGDPGRPTWEVAGATLAAVEGVINALPPHPVTLTVLASGDEVELYVTFDRPPRATPDLTALRRKVPATAGWHATVDIDETGAGCLEVRWRQAAA
jgi:hypothetical protein